jgi:hypothetical protein
LFLLKISKLLQRVVFHDAIHHVTQIINFHDCFILSASLTIGEAKDAISHESIEIAFSDVELKKV